MRHSTQILFPVLSALLAIGQKYDFRELYIDAQNRVYRAIPATLRQYDQVKNPEIVGFPNDLAQWVALARRTGLLSILPWTYLSCCKAYTADKIKNGLAEEGNKSKLSLHDQLTCLAGTLAIHAAQADTTYIWLHDVDTPLSSNCATTYLCTEIRRDVRVEKFPLAPDIMGFERWDSRFSSGLCKHCAAAARTKHEAGRKKLWNQLPGLFNLPPWSELLKEREEIHAQQVFHILSKHSHLPPPTENEAMISKDPHLDSQIFGLAACLNYTVKPLT